MFGFQKVIPALPSSRLPLVYRHPLQHLVTTLPYIDEELSDPRTLSAVQRMIHEEMRTMPEQDYLKDLPPPRVVYSEFMQAEMDRIEKGHDMQKTNFESKYLIETKPETEEEFMEALELTDLKEQHNQLKQQNLELLGKFGADSWKMLITQQVAEKDRLQKSLDKVKHQMNEVNAQRKFEQLNLKEKIDGFKYRIGEVKISNQELEIECMRLEDDILKIQKKKMVYKLA